MRLELQRKEQDLLQMQAKMKTVEEQHADYQKHIAVLKESLIAKEEHYNMLQIDVSVVWRDALQLGKRSLLLLCSWQAAAAALKRFILFANCRPHHHLSKCPLSHFKGSTNKSVGLRTAKGKCLFFRMESREFTLGHIWSR